MDKIERKWWKELVVYQVYPRSYKDSNGDGVGDINGITQSLDYIKSIGVDCIWLSPVYPSPNEDNGYDISDYRGIHPEFGTMEDWERFLKEAHARELKVVMDMVLNHTSEAHPWFKESSSSKENPFRDYYYWSEGRDGKEPNNWMSFFSGSAWAKNEATNDWYLHLFAKGQPDLNWENPKVRQEAKDVMHFWAQKGVDGFRLDVINVISKVPGLPDAPIKNKEQMYHWAGEHFFNGPKFMEWMREVKTEVFDKYDLFAVGETPDVTPAHGLSYTHELEGVVHMLFQFELMAVDTDPNGTTKYDLQPYSLSEVKRITSKWQTELGKEGWNSNYLENHDQPRSVSRFGDTSSEENRKISAKMLATWYLLLRGTPYVYQGQELGMTNVNWTSMNQLRDVEVINQRKEDEQRGMSEEQSLVGFRKKSRDNARTPMQWNSGANGGFCPAAVTPWLDSHENHTKINVEESNNDPDSVLNYYRKLMQLRKGNLVSIYGDYQIVDEENPKIYAYTRSVGDEKILVVTNWSKETAKFNPPKELDGSNLLLGNYPKSSETLSSGQEYRPFEARVYHFKP